MNRSYAFKMEFSRPFASESGLVFDFELGNGEPLVVKVALSAIPRCAIRFVAAPEAKALVEKTAQIDLSQFGGAVPADDFYYGAE